MAVKNFWALNPGETIFAEKLYQKFKSNLDLYFPIKDRGIDLLAVTKNKRNVLCFQIKESRYYEDKDHAWHQETAKKFAENKDDVDFYVFVIYLSGYLANAKKKNRFVIQFVIVPTDELIDRIKLKKPNKNGTYNFYFRFGDDGTLHEVREKKSVVQDNPKAFNYSEYLNAWNLIQEVMEI
jgi:hypothetical protein